MKISVAMCSYNGQSFIEEQIASIVVQTLPPDEIVICDDRSADETAALVDRFAQTSSIPVRLFVNPERLGSNRNFERAISLCSGDVIVLADQDDVWMKDKLATIQQAFEADADLGAIFSDAEVVDEHLVPLGYTIFENVGLTREERAKLNNDTAFDIVVARQFVTGATLAFRRNLVPRILPIPSASRSMIHDRWIGIVASATSRLRVLDRKLVKYRQHSRQQMGAPQVLQSTADRLATVRSNRPERYAEYLVFLSSLSEQLKERAGAMVKPEFQSALDDMILHLQTRCGLPTQRLRRIKPIMREWRAGRYRRFSNGTLSALKDWSRSGGRS